MCSLTLGAIVILNAQFGCDSPSTEAQPDAAKKSEPAKSEPAKSEPAKVEAAKTADPVPPDPSKVEPAVDPNAAPEPEPEKKNDPKAEAEPVYMPASKSGGDFGRMQFPGQANPAPQTPQQQAPK